MAARPSHARHRNSGRANEDIELPVLSVQPVAPDLSLSLSTQLSASSASENQHLLVTRRMPERTASFSKASAHHARFQNLKDDDFFAGWGSLTVLDQQDLKNINIIDTSSKSVKEARKHELGIFRATAIAGNAIFGSCFYALPTVAAVSGIFSPLSVFIACFVPFLLRPIMIELASCWALSGGPYVYLLNSSKSKILALVAASIFLLDTAATAAVSAASAMAYLEGEIAADIPGQWLAIALLALFSILTLFGVSESLAIALGMLLFHLFTMATIIVAGLIHWGKSGNGIIHANWVDGIAHGNVGLSIFRGICFGILFYTGFECTPGAIELLKPNRYPAVLRLLHYGFLALNPPLVLVTYATVSSKDILSGANVLSLVAESSAGKWLRIWLVVDAVLVLSGGVLTGVISGSSLLYGLARDQVLPSFMLWLLPYSRTPIFCTLAVFILAFVLYSTVAFSLATLSSIFSLTFLSCLALFPVSLIFLRYHRASLPRDKAAGRGMLLPFFATAVMAVVALGILEQDPLALAYFSAYTFVLGSLFVISSRKLDLLKFACWIYDQSSMLHQYRWTRSWGDSLIGMVRKWRRQAVLCFVKTDQISVLMKLILYIKANEATNNIKFVHIYEQESSIPSELDANYRILDEAFPEITIDLVLVKGSFEPNLVSALTRKFKVPQTMCFVGSPGASFGGRLADSGMRCIA